MKKIGIAMALVGFMAIWMGAEASDTGLEGNRWALATITGVLLMLVGIFMNQYATYIERKRAKKSIRYRRYLDTQEKMSTQEKVYVKRKADDKKTASRLQELRTETSRTETGRRKGLEVPADICTKLYRT